VLAKVGRPEQCRKGVVSCARLCVKLLLVMMITWTLHAPQSSMSAVSSTANLCTRLCCSMLIVVADFDSPLQLASPGGRVAQQFVPDEGSLSMIESMGFTRRQAVAALKATVRTPVMYRAAYCSCCQLEMRLWLVHLPILY